MQPCHDADADADVDVSTKRFSTALWYCQTTHAPSYMWIRLQKSRAERMHHIDQSQCAIR